MQSHRAVVIVTGHVIERTDFDDAGVVDQDVDPVETIDDLSNSGLNLTRIEQIALDNENFPSCRSEVGFGAVEYAGIPSKKLNGSALVANVSRQHEPESTRSATNQCNFIAQAVLRRTNSASGYPTAEQKSAGSEPNPSVHLHHL